MDDYWRELLHLNNDWFNHLDLKRGQFLYGAHVWELYRQAVVEGDICGFSPKKIFGEDYIRGNMMRDFFALNKVEYLYNENLPFLDKDISQEGLKELDHIAVITKDVDEHFDEIRESFSRISVDI